MSIQPSWALSRRDLANYYNQVRFTHNADDPRAIIPLKPDGHGATLRDSLGNPIVFHEEGSVLTDLDAPWKDDQFNGATLVITSGPNSGVFATIADTRAAAKSLVLHDSLLGGFPIIVDSGTTFEIISPYPTVVYAGDVEVMSLRQGVVEVYTPGTDTMLVQPFPIISLSSSRRSVPASLIFPVTSQVGKNMVYVFSGTRDDIAGSFGGIFRVGKTPWGVEGRFSGFVMLDDISSFSQAAGYPLFPNRIQYQNTITGRVDQGAMINGNDPRYGEALLKRRLPRNQPKRVPIYGRFLEGQDVKGHHFNDYGYLSGKVLDYVPGLVNLLVYPPHGGQNGYIFQSKKTKVYKTDIVKTRERYFAQSKEEKKRGDTAVKMPGAKRVIRFRLCIAQVANGVAPGNKWDVAVWIADECFEKPIKPFVPPTSHRALQAVALAEPPTDSTELDLSVADAGNINNALFEVTDPALVQNSQPFVRINAEGEEEGYNTSGALPVFSEIADHAVTHDIRVGQLKVVRKDGTDYAEFILKFNEAEGSSLLTLEDLKLYTSSVPAQTTTDIGSLGILRYDLHDGGAQAVLLDGERNSGNGSGALRVYIPWANFAGAESSDYVYLYSAFGMSDTGYEEWGISGAGTNTPLPAPRFIVTELGTLPGFVAELPAAINASGQIVGSCSDGTGGFRAWIWKPDVGMRPIPGLENNNSKAHAMNDSGHVVGVYNIPPNYGGWGRGFFWSQSTGIVDLGALSEGSYAYPYGINNHDEVTGMADTPGQVGFYWNRVTGITQIPTYDRSYPGYGSRINDSGLVLVNQWGRWAQIWNSKTGVYANLPRVMGFEGVYTGVDINDSGAILQLVSNSPQHHGFITNTGDVRDLGSNYLPHSLNNRQQVIGGSGRLWTNGRWIALSSLMAPSSNEEPALSGINDRGQICGRITREDKVIAALFTPESAPGTSHGDDPFEERIGPKVVAQRGLPAAGAGLGVRYGSFVDPATNLQDQSVFFGYLNGVGVNEANNEGIWRATSDSVMLLARKGEGAPGAGNGGVFGSLGIPAMGAAGDVAFSALLDGPGIDDSNGKGVWSGSITSNIVGLVARQGSPAPGTESGVLYDSFDNPVINGRRKIAFLASLSGHSVDDVNRRGIWAGSIGELALVARTGQRAGGPESDVLYADFNDVMVTDSDEVVFTASLTGPSINAMNGVGIWAAGTAGNLRLIARQSDIIQSVGGSRHAIEQLELFAATGDEGTDVKIGEPMFRAVFSDGTEAIFDATASPQLLAPSFIEHPTPQVVVGADSTTFNVKVAGTPPLTFQWQFNGATIPNATSAVLTLNDVRITQRGLYTATVSSAAGSATSTGAILDVIPTTFGDWRIIHFPSELDDLSKSGKEADYDRDGISNLLEYAFGLDPQSGDAKGLPEARVSHFGGMLYLDYSFRFAPHATDLGFNVEVSDDLELWDDSPDHAESVGSPVMNSDGLVETWTFRLHEPIDSFLGSRKFVRLRVTISQ